MLQPGDMFDIPRLYKRPASEKSTVMQEKALSHSEELFDKADTSKDGKLQPGNIRHILLSSPCIKGPHLRSQW